MSANTNYNKVQQVLKKKADTGHRIGQVNIVSPFTEGEELLIYAVAVKKQVKVENMKALFVECAEARKIAFNVADDAWDAWFERFLVRHPYFRVRLYPEGDILNDPNHMDKIGAMIQNEMSQTDYSVPPPLEMPKVIQNQTLVAQYRGKEIVFDTLPAKPKKLYVVYTNPLYHSRAGHIAGLTVNLLECDQGNLFGLIQQTVTKSINKYYDEANGGCSIRIEILDGLRLHSQLATPLVLTDDRDIATYLKWESRRRLEARSSFMPVYYAHDSIMTKEADDKLNEMLSDALSKVRKNCALKMSLTDDIFNMIFEKTSTSTNLCTDLYID